MRVYFFNFLLSFQKFFENFESERNVTNFGYAFVLRFHITHKDFPGDLTNISMILASIFFKKSILKNVKIKLKNFFDTDTDLRFYPNISQTKPDHVYISNKKIGYFFRDFLSVGNFFHPVFSLRFFSTGIFVRLRATIIIATIGKLIDYHGSYNVGMKHYFK